MRFTVLFEGFWVGSGELAVIQANAGAVDTSVALAVMRQGQNQRVMVESRGHLEANVASAQLLRSPVEYRRWLHTYVRHLSGEQI